MVTLDPVTSAVNIVETSEPPASTTATNAGFQFQTTNQVQTTRCSLDGAPFALCTTGLAAGPHTFRVQGIDAAGTVSSASYAWTVGAASPAPAAPASVTPPTIGGSVLQGSTLTATSGTWSGTPGPTFALQWKRCSAAGICTPIAGATAATYQLTAADVGSTIEITVTATNPAGSTSATSGRSAAVSVATVAVRITRLSVSKVHGAYVVHLAVTQPGAVSVVVRRVARTQGRVLARIGRTLPAGASTLRLTSTSSAVGPTACSSPSGAPRAT